eukprot:TRINITY_DN28678_c0_g1_i2.p2 TRINITY_DN28678_c0_g1~~TRINITY_DN28678_c0_g1_i2.p2  ORF type:complete len:249 (-),score=61.02 TRINITY_DN28678_c0_g1_i2:45-791(-)
MNNSVGVDESKMSSGVVQALLAVRSRIDKVAARLNLSQMPRLVAVSKTKPNELLMEVYDGASQRHFGENYVQELVTKAEQLPKDIRWHFIGHLQSNKCKQLLSVENLFLVETVDSTKLASKLDSTWGDLSRPNKLNVMVQVNTSNEQSKSGVEPSECVELAKHVKENCSNLNLLGLMTIGSFSEEPTRDCFDVLVTCRDKVAEALGVQPSELELSMGMSHDFELAIECGSTNVRVGSTIFGARNYSSS